MTEKYNSQNRWTADEKKFVFDNIGKMTYEDIAVKLQKSEMALRIFLHRHRTNPRTVLKDNIVLKILQERFVYPEFFMPTREFYNNVKIGQRRWWLLYKGVERARDEECNRIIDYLQVDRKEFFVKLQLELF
ncbi:MAG: XRE family transcriptional regulator [Prevotellaceae bacterium]|jgi:hypothetical protein|nr:XRE family transcriptional regulator [Prevotellaceae bacterium]